MSGGIHPRGEMSYTRTAKPLLKPLGRHSIVRWAKRIKYPCWRHAIVRWRQQRSPSEGHGCRVGIQCRRQLRRRRTRTGSWWSSTVHQSEKKMLSIEAGGGIPCRPNPPATLLVTFLTVQKIWSVLVGLWPWSLTFWPWNWWSSGLFRLSLYYLTV